jgi:CarD family transcriptional regulator
MSKDVINQIKALIKHLKNNPEALKKAKIYDLKSRKLLSDTNSKPKEDFSEPKTQFKPGPVNPEFGNHDIYAIKLKDGSHLVGRNMAKQGKSPNHHDVLNWLKDKNVQSELVDPVNFIKTHKKTASSILEHIKDNPHKMVEISGHDGSTILMNSLIEKHPDSPDYKQNNYIPQDDLRNVNFAFTPYDTINVLRFGTPEGNLFVTKMKNSKANEERYAISSSKEESRKNAYFNKKTGGTGNPGFMPEVFGKTTPNGKLIVGANVKIKEKLPFFILQHFDPMPFYEKTENGHRVGIVGLSREGSLDPIYTHSESNDPDEAFSNALKQFALEVIKSHNLSSEDPSGEMKNKTPGSTNKNAKKLNAWLQNSVYRSPKVSLKDLLGVQQLAQKSLSNDYFESLKKAKIIDFKTRQPLADLGEPLLSAPPKGELIGIKGGKKIKTKKTSKKTIKAPYAPKKIQPGQQLDNYIQEELKELETRDVDNLHTIMTENLSDMGWDVDSDDLYHRIYSHVNPKISKTQSYFQNLKKAKIYSFKDKKVLTSLPSTVTPKETQPIFRNKKKGITNRKYLKQVYSPNIMPEKQDVPGGEGTGKSENYFASLKKAVIRGPWGGGPEKPGTVLHEEGRSKEISDPSDKHVNTVRVHKAHGIGKIVGKEERDLGEESKQPYYKMAIKDGLIDKHVFIPAKDIDIRTRPVINQNEVQKLKTYLKTPEDIDFGQTWQNRYKNMMDSLQSGNIYDTAKIWKTLMNKNKAGDGLSFGERKLLQSAHNQLDQEIQAVTGQEFSEDFFKKKEGLIKAGCQKCKMPTISGFSYCPHCHTKQIKQPKQVKKSKNYYNDLIKSVLEKAKIYDFKSRKLLVDLPKPEVKAYLVNSDNFENALLTPKAYNALKLEMSSGDYGSHEAKPVFDFSEHAQKDIIDFDGQNYINSTMKTESLLKAKVFSLASGKLQFDTSSPEENQISMDLTDPSHLMSADVLPQKDPRRKRGMYIVGSNTFQRKSLPLEILKSHDVHYHFFPSAERKYKIGATLLERNGDKAIFVETEGLDVNNTLKELNKKIEQKATDKQTGWHKFDSHKMGILSNHLYKQPKISLKDVQQLEPYKEV